MIILYLIHEFPFSISDDCIQHKQSECDDDIQHKTRLIHTCPLTELIKTQILGDFP